MDAQNVRLTNTIWYQCIDFVRNSERLSINLIDGSTKMATTLKLLTKMADTLKCDN